MLGHVDEDIQIARRAAAQAGLALPRQPDPGAGLDAGRDRDVERPVLAGRPLAAAGGTRALDDLAASGAGRAASFDGEKPLLGADLAVKNPCWARTLPCPLQVGQVWGLAPPSAPLPLQELHLTEPGTEIDACLPLNASSSEMLRL
jgi:hypothetical protein